MVNELHVRRHRSGPGGTIKGRFDDAAMFDAIAALIDAKAKPLDKDDLRGWLGVRPKPWPISAALCSTAATTPGCPTAGGAART